MKQKELIIFLPKIEGYGVEKMHLSYQITYQIKLMLL